jgi:hypothetical protein
LRDLSGGGLRPKRVALRLVVATPAVAVVVGCAATGATPTIDTPAQAPPTVTQAEPDDFPQVAGYDRSCNTGHACSFGPAWSDDVDQDYGHNGCDTRNDILRRDLVNVTLDPKTRGCVVVSGRLNDPYSGQVVDFPGPNSVQIDHVFPLAAAGDRGAWRWTAEERRNFANDPADLQTTTTAMNASKSDKLPGDWMPVVEKCEYARRVAVVADKRHLPLTSRDVAAPRGCRS